MDAIDWIKKYLIIVGFVNSFLLANKMRINVIELISIKIQIISHEFDMIKIMGDENNRIIGIIFIFLLKFIYKKISLSLRYELNSLFSLSYFL